MKKCALFNGEQSLLLLNQPLMREWSLDIVVDEQNFPHDCTDLHYCMNKHSPREQKPRKNFRRKQQIICTYAVRTSCFVTTFRSDFHTTCTNDTLLSID